MNLQEHWTIDHPERRHGQEGALAPPLPSGNAVMCFCAVTVSAKRSDELFIHYFHNQSSARLPGLRPQAPPEIHPWTPLWDFVHRVAIPLICPALEKNPACAHERQRGCDVRVGGGRIQKARLERGLGGFDAPSRDVERRRRDPYVWAGGKKE